MFRCVRSRWAWVLIAGTDGSCLKPCVSCNDSRVSVIISQSHHTALLIASTFTAAHRHHWRQTGLTLPIWTTFKYFLREWLHSVRWTRTVIFHIGKLPSHQEKGQIRNRYFSWSYCSDELLFFFFFLIKLIQEFPKLTRVSALTRPLLIHLQKHSEETLLAVHSGKHKPGPHSLHQSWSNSNIKNDIATSDWYLWRCALGSCLPRSMLLTREVQWVVAASFYYHSV